jgi:hypothetical protein
MTDIQKITQSSMWANWRLFSVKRIGTYSNQYGSEILMFIKICLISLTNTCKIGKIGYGYKAQCSLYVQYLL